MSVSSTMSASLTGHGTISSPTTTRPTPHTAGAASNSRANVTPVPSCFRHPRDLVRRALTQQHVALDEVDLRADADGLLDRVLDAGPQRGQPAGALRRVADPQLQHVDLTRGTDHLEEAVRLVDALDRAPHVTREHGHAVDEQLVALAPERPHATMRATAPALLA